LLALPLEPNHCLDNAVHISAICIIATKDSREGERINLAALELCDACLVVVNFEIGLEILSLH
jgi:hypothetical protein